MKLTTGGVTVNIELEPVIKGDEAVAVEELIDMDAESVHLVGKSATGLSPILSKGTGTSDTVTEIDRLLAKADATTDICLRAGYREKAALLRGAS